MLRHYTATNGHEPSASAMGPRVCEFVMMALRVKAGGRPPSLSNHHRDPDMVSAIATSASPVKPQHRQRGARAQAAQQQQDHASEGVGLGVTWDRGAQVQHRHTCDEVHLGLSWQSAVLKKETTGRPGPTRRSTRTIRVKITHGDARWPRQGACRQQQATHKGRW